MRAGGFPMMTSRVSMFMVARPSGHADENAERRALGQRLRFSNCGYDAGGSYGKSIVNIIPHVNYEVDLEGFIFEHLTNYGLSVNFAWSAFSAASTFSAFISGTRL
jgi:hypothetical protein